MTRQRRGQVIAQRQPLLVIVLEREDAFIGAVHIRQELAQRVGIFEGRRLQRLEAITFIDPADGVQHVRSAAISAGAAVAETARQPGFGSGLLGRTHGSCRNLEIVRGCTGPPDAAARNRLRAVIRYYISNTYKRAALPLAPYHVAMRTRKKLRRSLVSQSKVYPDAASALEGVTFDGMTVMSGGFGLSRQSRKP